MPIRRIHLIFEGKTLKYRMGSRSLICIRRLNSLFNLHLSNKVKVHLNYSPLNLHLQRSRSKICNCNRAFNTFRTMSRPHRRDREGAAKGAASDPSTSTSHAQHNVALSKALSWLLRHNAVKEGLQVHSGGFVNVEDVLKHARFSRWTANDIQAVVEGNDKQRFSLREDPQLHKLQIRANQGHSFHVDDTSLLEPILLADPHFPSAVIHGTYLRYWDAIRTQGLSRMKRNHIHFAAGEPGDKDVISGMRQSVDIFIYVDARKGIEDGLKFYRSENNVILSPGNAEGFLAPKYFAKVVDVKKKQLLLQTN